jgi:probable F420-dependent oxidoreductase
VKVRIGFGFGVRTALNDQSLGVVVDELESLCFDSLWFSERLGGAAPDPLVAMAYAAGRTTKLKFGMSVMVLPGRNPVVLAKELATLDRLSGGRLLPAFGLGVADAGEQQAFGVERAERAAIFDEAMAVLRGAWSAEPFTFHGKHFHYENLRVEPKPRQHHVDVWLGGIAPSELRRVARHADGWLPAFVTPDDAARGRETIEAALAENDREIEDDHYGVLIPYVLGDVPDALLAGLRARRPDLDDLAQLVPTSWESLMTLIDQFVAIGTTKFVIVPMVEPEGPDGWVAHLRDAAPIVLARQT